MCGNTEKPEGREGWNQIKLIYQWELANVKFWTALHQVIQEVRAPQIFKKS